MIKSNELLRGHIGEFYPHQNQLPDRSIVYHYTTLKSVISIIESKHLWLTDHNYLNDPSELQYSTKYFSDNLFSDEPRSEKSNFQRSQLHALKLKPMYVISFCERKDYLPAWRFYADDAAGCTIGFNWGSIKNLNNYREDTFRFPVGKINFEGNSDRVYYPNEKIENHKLHKNWFKKLVEFHYESSKYNYGVEEFRMSIRSLFPVIKHPAYREEREVRIAISNLGYNTPEDAMRTKIMYYTRNEEGTDKEIPHLKIPFDLHSIREIEIGPRANCDQSCLEVVKLLEKHKLGHIQVYNSDIPYKNNLALL